MSFRRQWRSFLKKRIFLIILILTLVSIALMYHALLSYSTKPSYDQSILSNGQKQRFHPNHKARNSKSNETSVAEYMDTLVYQNLIPLEADTLKNRDLLNAKVKEGVANFLLTLYPSNWASAQDTEEMALELKHVLADYGMESNMSCKEIDNIHVTGALYSSRSKTIEKGKVNKYSGYNSYSYNQGDNNAEYGSVYAIRSVISDMDTKVACMKHIYEPELCSTMGNYRLLREVVFLSVLHHPSVVRLNGYCLRGSRMSTKLQNKGVVIVTEVGVPLSQQTIYSSTWSSRVKFALQVAHLLTYMDVSPFGSLAFTKLDIKDFIVVDGQTVKLADLDNVEVGERTCQQEADCIIGKLSKGVSCKNGICEGLNSRSNLFLATQAVLLPLLYSPSGSEARDFVSKLTDHELTIRDLVSGLTDIFKALLGLEEYNTKEHFETYDERRKRIQEKRFDVTVKTQEIQERDVLDEVMAMFVREDKKNFPGIYDYHCAESRVKWGCVVNVKSLQEAANLCLSDSTCQAFVVFSTHPETEKIMTVVFKNETDANPYHSSGTTLFLRRSTLGNKVVKKVEMVEDENKEQLVSSSKTQSCIKSVSHVQETSRSLRENRLMTHLGLKSIKEQSWRNSTSGQKLGEPSRITRVSGGGGGRFLINLIDLSQETSAVEKVTFIAEDSSKVNHKSYALVYILDRLLGLYHTPPCVGKTISSKDVRQFKNNSAWSNIFSSLIAQDGTLQGIMVAPTPKVMKISKLTLTPLASFTSKVISFDRLERLQLEYVMLCWLARIKFSDTDHLGYKGHLIHFSADQAFTDASLDFSEYMNHCQFPTIAFKNLICFRCVSDKDSKKFVSKVCGLGQEVLKQGHSLLGDSSEISINELSEQDISKTIDEVASDMLTIVDKCIKVHGREAVLY